MPCSPPEHPLGYLAPRLLPSPLPSLALTRRSCRARQSTDSRIRVATISRTDATLCCTSSALAAWPAGPSAAGKGAFGSEGGEMGGEARHRICAAPATRWPPAQRGRRLRTREQRREEARAMQGRCRCLLKAARLGRAPWRRSEAHHESRSSRKGGGLWYCSPLQDNFCARPGAARTHVQQQRGGGGWDLPGRVQHVVRHARRALAPRCPDHLFLELLPPS